MKLSKPQLALSAIAFTFAGLGGAIAILRLWTVVPVGQVGVVDTFGQVAEQPLNPGIHLRNPFSKIIHFATRTKELKETAESPSKDGLITTVDVSILYRIDPAQAKRLYQTVGGDYESVILIPYLRSHLRRATANFNAKDLYTTQRQALAEQLRRELQATVSDRGLIVEDTPIRNIILPESLQKAVQSKLQAEQDSQRMQFVLQKEQQEAERKRIEARGIADAQRIIGQGLTEKTLRFRQIEATEKLAQSQNTKIVVIGEGGSRSTVQLQP
ncbi:MAG: prohibitin family protein [Leptolyngbyaceae cyanobacterium bins.349]|nr:prohibitin family protein [Leptolyngbyaceae cyanobacterium bins.349]